MDNIIVSLGGAAYEEAVQNHVQRLRLMLPSRREKNLAVSADKAKMFVKEVDFAGHVVGYGIKRPIAGKNACLETWDKPRTVLEFRAFLSFANYYQEFVCLYADHAAPVYSVIPLSKSEARKGSNHALHWTLELDSAFEHLERELLHPIALFLVIPNKPFIIPTDPTTPPWVPFWNRMTKWGPVSLLPPGGSHGPPGPRRPMQL